MIKCLRKRKKWYNINFNINTKIMKSNKWFGIRITLEGFPEKRWLKLKYEGHVEANEEVFIWGKCKGAKEAKKGLQSRFFTSIQWISKIWLWPMPWDGHAMKYVFYCNPRHNICICIYTKQKHYRKYLKYYSDIFCCSSSFLSNAGRSPLCWFHNLQ